jgi:acetylornithine deacetylase
MTPRQLIDRLIGFDTVSRDSNMALIDFVRGYLSDFGVDSHLVPNSDGRKANLYATVGPPVEGGVVLSGHTDVVPVDGQPWTSDPFVVVERDEHLFGRGTCDMKSFIAIALSLLPEMDKLKKPIHFAFSYDEEIGCIGAPHMIAKLVDHLPKPAAVIVGEPTDMKVVTAHKGMTAMKTVVTGHEAHSSQTHRGVSAVMTAAHLIEHLAQIAEQRRVNADDNCGFEPAYTSIHVGLVRGGTAVNIISRQCEFEWDIRSIPGDDPLEIVEGFRHYCATEVEPKMKAVAKEAGIDTTIGVQTPGLKPEPESSAEQLAKLILGDHTTHKVPYAAEAGQFQEAGFATIICGPGSIDQAHQPDEYISLQQVAAGEAFLRKVVQHLS